MQCDVCLGYSPIQGICKRCRKAVCKDCAQLATPDQTLEALCRVPLKERA